MDVLAIWILYGIVGFVVASLLFIWAVRNRQFEDQERARYLPLREPESEPGEESAQAGTHRGGGSKTGQQVPEDAP